MTIPTRSRFATPRALAYPLGAELISNALLGVSHYDELSVTFFCQGDVHEIENAWSRGERIDVITAEYVDPKTTAHTAQVLDRPPESWTLWVYPVPSKRKAEVRRALLEQGLTHIRDWLQTPRSANWLAARKRITISVRPQDCAVSARESGQPA